MATTASNTPALEISNLEAWYGESHVLHGVDIVQHTRLAIPRLCLTSPSPRYYGQSRMPIFARMSFAMCKLNAYTQLIT